MSVLAPSGGGSADLLYSTYLGGSLDDRITKLGKVPEEDYPTQRTNLLQKGAAILKRLDELTPQVKLDDKDAKIERALVSRRKKTSGQKPTDDDIESMVAARRKGRKSKSAGFCPKCGKPVMANDKICPSCGKALA